MPTSYNCACDEAPAFRTLLQLRQDMMRNLGYAAQVASPPPGLAELLTTFLQTAHRLLYERFPQLRTERMFTWTLVDGTNLYDLDGNDEQTIAPVCTKQLNALQITWVGVERDSWWYPLARGIPPEAYTHTQTGWPQRYDIRQCIEVWPTPGASAGKLRIRGAFLPEAFAADADKPTIDDTMVFLLAMANAKAHYRHPDAGNYVQQLETYAANRTAGLHGTARYIPGERGHLIEPEPVWTGTGSGV